MVVHHPYEEGMHGPPMSSPSMHMGPHGGPGTPGPHPGKTEPSAVTAAAMLNVGLVVCRAI